jgi:hypothetical protein
MRSSGCTRTRLAGARDDHPIIFEKLASLNKAPGRSPGWSRPRDFDPPPRDRLKQQTHRRLCDGFWPVVAYGSGTVRHVSVTVGDTFASYTILRLLGSGAWRRFILLRTRDEIS